MTSMIEKAARADEEELEGYLDGLDLDTPEPSANRSARYRHCFECGRSDRAKRSAFGGYHAALKHAEQARAQDAQAGHILNPQDTPGSK